MKMRHALLISLLALVISAAFWGLKKHRDRFEADLVRKAQAGDPVAQTKLAKAYLDGQKNLPKDEKAAFDWYSRAAVQGYAKAQAGLGWMYANGKGVKKDDVAAFQWFQKAALQGDLYAERNVGARYAKGIGVPQDYLEADLWLRKAAEQG